MILEHYINYERPIHNALIEMVQLTSPTDFNKLFKSDKQLFFIFFNLGNIAEIETAEKKFLCPPKNGIMGIKGDISINIHAKNQFRGTLLLCKNTFKKKLLKKILSSIQQRYAHLIETEDFLFDFPLSIKQIETLESLYQTQINYDCNFYKLEIECLTIQLIIHILRIVLNLDQKYIEQFSSFDTKYYSVLKTFFEHPVTLDETLALYNMSRERFTAHFTSKNPEEEITQYLTREKAKCEGRLPLIVDMEDEAEEVREL